MLNLGCLQGKSLHIIRGQENLKGHNSLSHHRGEPIPITPSAQFNTLSRTLRCSGNTTLIDRYDYDSCNYISENRVFYNCCNQIFPSLYTGRAGENTINT